MPRSALPDGCDVGALAGLCHNSALTLRRVGQVLDRCLVALLPDDAAVASGVLESA